jgi:3-hydroxyisobutyrate dehydrogenase-like beta-hydroxyacid dehydrogenase
VETVLTGAGGIIEHARAGVIVIDTSTSDPESSLRMSSALKKVGMEFVDAPLGRTPKEAALGTVDALVGADDHVFEIVKPIIASWSATVTHLGAVGSGHKMKLIMNFLAMSYGALYSEATVLAAKSGISPQKVNDVIGNSRLNTGFFETFMKYLVGRDPNAHQFSLTNAAKDISYVNQMAHDAGMANLMSAAAKQYYMHATAIGAGDDYVPMLVDHIAKLNGINIQDEVIKGEDDT